MKTFRFFTIAPLLLALMAVTSCTAQEAPQVVESITASPRVTPPGSAGAVADPCQARLISGYPAGSHAHPVILLKLRGPEELEAAKDVLLGSVRSANDHYGFAVRKGEFVHYLTDEEKECVNSVPGVVDYFLTSVNDAPHLAAELQLGGPSLFVSNVQSA